MKESGYDVSLLFRLWASTLGLSKPLRYGNTVFNRLQMEILLDDLDKLEQAVKTAKEVRLERRIRDFARRSKEEPHLYLNFYGD